MVVSFRTVYFLLRYAPVTDTAEQDSLDHALTADHEQYAAMDVSRPRLDLDAEQYAPMESRPANAASRYEAVARSQFRHYIHLQLADRFAVLRVH